MKCSQTENDLLVLQLGIQDSRTEWHLSIGSWLAIAALILVILLRATSVWKGLLALIVLSPLFFGFFILAIPNSFFAKKISIDRKNRILHKNARWLNSKHSSFRRFNEISSILLLTDQAQYGSHGTGDRIRLFLALAEKSRRQKVIYLDYFPCTDSANIAVQQISAFTGWPVEYVELSRSAEDTDYDWVSW